MTSFPRLTMRHVHALAAARGYQVLFSERGAHSRDRYFDRPGQTFDFNVPFPIDPVNAEEWHLTRLYFWMMGYHLRFKDLSTICIERAATHPLFKETVPCAMQMEYTDLFQMQCELAFWVLRVDVPRTAAEQHRSLAYRTDLVVHKLSDERLRQRYLKERHKQQKVLHFLRTKSPGKRPALPNTLMINRCKQELERRGLPLPSVPESFEQE